MTNLLALLLYNAAFLLWLRALLAGGKVRLLRVSFLLDTAKHSHLGTTRDGRPTFRRMQELPEAAFATPEEAARTFDRGDRSIVVLSHPWRSPTEPDPDGTTFFRLTAHLAREMEKEDAPKDLLLFAECAARAELEHSLGHAIRPLCVRLSGG